MKKLLIILASLGIMHANATADLGSNTHRGYFVNCDQCWYRNFNSIIGIRPQFAWGIGRPLSAGLFIQRSDNPATNQDGGLKILFSSNAFTGTGQGIAGGSCALQLVPTSNSIAPDMAFPATMWRHK
jgi:hypothetical protein